jgi:hypothetical protein
MGKNYNLKRFTPSPILEKFEGKNLMGETKVKFLRFLS